MAHKYPCPVCETEFARRKGKNCPNCGTELVLTRKKEGTLNVIVWVALDEKRPKPVEPEPVDSRVVVDQSDIKIIRTGEKEWHILYKALPQRGICPNCNKVLFKHPRFLKGALQMKCDRCKHLVTTEFDVLSRQRRSPSP